MKRLITCGAAMAAILVSASGAFAWSNVFQPELVGPAADVEQCASFASCGDEPACCCEPSCECACGDNCGCSDCCGCGCSCFDCCLGDAWCLKDEVAPCCSIDFGGWLQLGYHTDPTRQSVAFNDGRAFNDVPNQLNLHQAWLYAEKVANSCGCCCDWGFRVDMMYGTDAQKTQANGNPRANVRNQGRWDASFDNGEYGWAIPQLYGEVAYGDWSVIAGHFFTLVGYEVVTAPDNFFYSHSLTMFNSEPFTHTGALATYSGMGGVEFYAGWTLGWDTGFDQFGGGSSWLGGFSACLTNDVTFTYISTAGNFGRRSSNTNGYSHSVVLDTAVSECLTYVMQSDYVHADDGDYDVGINQYLFYTLNDCWAVGGRFEWWKSNANSPTNSVDYYELTLGANYKPHANVVIRPEIRWDWTDDEAALGNGRGTNPSYDETTLGIDAIFTF